MPRWSGPKFTEEQKRIKRNEYAREYHARRQIKKRTQFIEGVPVTSRRPFDMTALDTDSLYNHLIAAWIVLNGRAAKFDQEALDKVEAFLRRMPAYQTNLKRLQLPEEESEFPVLLHKVK